MLNRDQILNRQVGRFETVTVPEWGGDVRLKALCVRDKAVIDTEMMRVGKLMRTQDLDAAIAKAAVIDHPGDFAVLGSGIDVDDLAAMIIINAAALVAFVLDRRPETCGIDQLHLLFPVRSLFVREDPEVSADACAEEDFRGQRHDGFNQIVFKQPATNFRFS